MEVLSSISSAQPVTASIGGAGRVAGDGMVSCLSPFFPSVLGPQGGKSLLTVDCLLPVVITNPTWSMKATQWGGHVPPPASAPQ